MQEKDTVHMAEEKEGQAGSAFEELRKVIAMLRGENGCPWDRVQTFESLKPCMIDEMTEALAAIRVYKETGDADNLCEELGDVLMQVMLLSQIAEEEGLFTVEDVVRGLSGKMIRRHPHVFGSEEERAAGATPGRWEEIKKEEKKERGAKARSAEKEAFAEAAEEVVARLQKKPLK